ncbi:MAG: type I-A CRISPR-associated protein Cas4/Csa1 [Pyrobaculum sp.]
MLTLLEIARLLRRARTIGHGDVSPELRGWSYDRPPVRPPAYLGLALSDFAYGYCPTLRNVYLKYVLGERGAANRQLAEGRLLHTVLFRAVEDYKQYVYAGRPMSPSLEAMPEEVRQKAEALYRHIATRLLGEHAHVTATGLARSKDSAAFYVAPLSTQVAVDGTPLGLSHVVADGVAMGAVVEFKFGPAPNTDVALAGYAMAIEAEYGVPIDYGIYVQISINGAVEYRTYVYHLGDGARQKFLQARDDAIDVASSARDPGPAAGCPKACPYFHTCHADSRR